MNTCTGYAEGWIHTVTVYLRTLTEWVQLQCLPLTQFSDNDMMYGICSLWLLVGCKHNMLEFRRRTKKQVHIINTAYQELLTLGLLLIASSGQKNQTHDQIVEVQPFRRASERGVDHLKHRLTTAWPAHVLTELTMINRLAGVHSFDCSTENSSELISCHHQCDCD